MKKRNIWRILHIIIKHLSITLNYTIQLNGSCQYIEHQINYKGKEDEKCLDKE